MAACGYIEFPKRIIHKRVLFCILNLYYKNTILYKYTTRYISKVSIVGEFEG